MKEVSDLTFGVIDHGGFLTVALRLAEEAKRVIYYSPAEKGMPTVLDVFGDGFDSIERVDSWIKYHDEVDCWVFPDVGFLDEHEHLVKEDKLVWGGGPAQLLETMRGKFLTTLTTTDLPVPKYTKVKGMNNLRSFLKEKEDVYIKCSRWRGDWETLHWRSWALDEGELDVRAVRLGPWKELIMFYVFEPIDTEIEDGVDTNYIAGAGWPAMCLHAMECKDRALLGTFQETKSLPTELWTVNDQFGPILEKSGYRGPFSTEVRITKDGESFFIDPTIRYGSPPHQTQCYLIKNFAEQIYAGAQGEIVEPEPSASVGVQALVKMPADDTDWRIVEVSKELAPLLAPAMCSKIDDRYCFPPGTYEQVLWLRAKSDTIAGAIRALKENEKLLPDGCHCEMAGLVDLLKEIEAADEAGVPFTDKPVPPPSIVFD